MKVLSKVIPKRLSSSGILWFLHRLLHASHPVLAACILYFSSFSLAIVFLLQWPPWAFGVRFLCRECINIFFSLKTPIVLEHLLLFLNN